MSLTTEIGINDRETSQLNKKNKKADHCRVMCSEGRITDSEIYRGKASFYVLRTVRARRIRLKVNW